MSQIIFFIPELIETGVTSNLGLCRALIQSDMLARFNNTKGIFSPVHYIFPNEEALLWFQAGLKSATKSLRLLPHGELTIVDRSKPSCWPDGNVLFYPSEHITSPYIWVNIESSAKNEDTDQLRWGTICEYTGLKINNKPSLTFDMLMASGYSIGQLRLLLSSTNYSCHSIAQESIDDTMDVLNTVYASVGRIPMVPADTNADLKSKIGIYHRRLHATSTAFGGNNVYQAVHNSLQLLTYEENEICFSPGNSEPFYTGQEWHLVFRYILAADPISAPIFPSIDQGAMDNEIIEIPVQLDGKIRGRINVTRASFDNEEALLEIALSLPNVKRYIDQNRTFSSRVVPFKIIAISTI